MNIGTASKQHTNDSFRFKLGHYKFLVYTPGASFKTLDTLSHVENVTSSHDKNVVNNGTSTLPQNVEASADDPKNGTLL